MALGILEEQALSSIEKTIIGTISKCEFWGDLELTYDEMEILKHRIKDILSSDKVSISSLCKMYPHSITTYMVFFVRYKYNLNFWGVLEGKRKG